MQDIIDGLHTLSNTNIDWSMSAGPVWVLGGIVFFLGWLAAGVCRAACEPRVVCRRP